MGFKFNPLIFNGLDFSGSSSGGSGANSTLSNLTSPTALNQSLNFGNGLTINDVDENPAVDPNNRRLIDSNNGLSINWESRTLDDASENVSIAWNTRQLKDGSNVIGLNWSTRSLVDAGNTTIATWAGPSKLSMSVPLLASNGTVSLPSLSFVNNTNLGFYRSASNEMSIALLGTQQFAINQTNLGGSFGGALLNMPAETGQILIGGVPGTGTGGSGWANFCSIGTASSLYPPGIYATGVNTNYGRFISKAAGSGGTVASPTAVGNSQILGVYGFDGFNGTGYLSTGLTSMGSQMFSQTSQAWSVGATGCDIFIDTTANGTTGVSPTLKIVNDGSLLLRRTTGANINWATDGAGSIGATGANRPLNLFLAGNASIEVAGKGLKVKEGSNAKMGASALTAGAVVVSNTSVTATSRIFLTSQVDGGTPGFVRVSTRSVGTSFTITSSLGTDTSTIAWMIVEPA